MTDLDEMASVLRRAGLGLGYTDAELPAKAEELMALTRSTGRDGRDLVGLMDACLIAITDGNPIPSEAIAALPPWRAVLLARVADKAGVDLEHGTLDQLVAEATRVGGAGTLVWPRGRTSHRRPPS